MYARQNTQKMRVVKDIDEALDRISGTHLIGYLDNVTYNDLLHALGEPIFNEASGDDKVQFEWVVQFDYSYYTIYDWKTYDRDFSMSYLRQWNIGGKGTLPRRFKDVLKSMIEASRDSDSTHIK